MPHLLKWESGRRQANNPTKHRTEFELTANGTEAEKVALLILILVIKESWTLGRHKKRPSTGAIRGCFVSTCHVALLFVI
jgi:hypothetical protein